jgi:hypothetical protein
MGLLWGVGAVLVAFLWIVTLFDLLRRHLGSKQTAAWALIIVLLPFVGAIGYWIMRKPPADEVRRAMDTENEIRRGAAPPRV